jgi:DNA-binding CsgD family transcriptional regulator
MHPWSAGDVPGREHAAALDFLKRLQFNNSHEMPLSTRREEDVVRLVALGPKNREFAQRCKVNEHSIRNCLYRILETLGVLFGKAGRKRTTPIFRIPAGGLLVASCKDKVEIETIGLNGLRARRILVSNHSGLLHMIEIGFTEY